MAFPLGKILGKVIKVLRLVKGIVNVLSGKKKEEKDNTDTWMDSQD